MGTHLSAKKGVKTDGEEALHHFLPIWLLELLIDLIRDTFNQSSLTPFYKIEEGRYYFFALCISLERLPFDSCPGDAT